MRRFCVFIEQREILCYIFDDESLNHGIGFMNHTEIQYISDESGNPVGVIVPIELWREIESERETAYLLKSENTKRRLLEAKDRAEGIPFDEACKKLGI